MQTYQKKVKILLPKNTSIAIAESCTGGLLANTLTNISGASSFFWLGIIAYDNRAKTKLLKIPTALIVKHGAVSRPVAALMAKNVRQLLDTDLGIGITGIAGPTGGSKLKPVGLVYIAVASRRRTRTHAFHFKGSRLAVKKQAVQEAIDLLIKAST